MVQCTIDFSLITKAMDRIYACIDDVVSDSELHAFSHSCPVRLIHDEKNVEKAREAPQCGIFWGNINKYNDVTKRFEVCHEEKTPENLINYKRFLCKGEPADGLDTYDQRVNEMQRTQTRGLTRHSACYMKLEYRFGGMVSSEVHGWFIHVPSQAVVSPNDPWIDILCACLESGYIPIYWHGPYPEGHLVAYALPGRAMPLPKRNIPTKEQLEAGKILKVKPIDRMKLPIVDRPVFDPKEWPALMAMPLAEAVRTLLGPILEGSGEQGDKVLGLYVRQARSLDIVREKRVERLALKMECHPESLTDIYWTLYLSSPWTGTVEGLPPGVIQVIRRHNGIWFKENDGDKWFEYKGPQKLFPVEWDIWGLCDEPTGEWKKLPIVPFTFGSNLWAYHPARMHNDHLALVSIDHEGGTFEICENQHIGYCFLNYLRYVIGFHEPLP